MQADLTTLTSPAVPPVRPAGRFAWSWNWSWGLVPASAVLAVCFLLPLLYLAMRSLHVSTGPGQEAAKYTISNYADVVGDIFYWQLLLSTSVLGLLVSGIALLLAFPMSYFLARSKSPLREALFFVVIAPLLISVVIRNLGWIPVLGDNGMVNWLLLHAGLVESPIHLVNNRFGVVVALVHALLPFLIMTLTTVIQRVDPALEEASISLGAGQFETFVRVLLPLTRPGLTAGLLVIFTLAISAYTTPALMGGGRVLVIATYIQQEFSTLLDYAKGAAVAVILIAWALSLSIVAIRLGRTE